MTSERRIYKIKPVTVNGIKVDRVIIDAHYEVRHRRYMSDDLILKLVYELDGRRELPEAKTEKYSYFATVIEMEDRSYRLIWLLEDHMIYIGVVNAYRERRRRR